MFHPQSFKGMTQNHHSGDDNSMKQPAQGWKDKALKLKT
jgi:hypothetical protein